jgi:hypothetical protein
MCKIRAERMREYNEERSYDTLAQMPPATYQAQIMARRSPLEMSP